MFARSIEQISESTEFWYSLGMHVNKNGVIYDVLKDGVAEKAGIGPGMHLIAVNGRGFSPELLRAAIRDAKGSGPATELILENTGYYRVAKLDYHDGERYPFLERTDGSPDRLDEILRPLAK